MSSPHETQARQPSAPNAILEHMRRRIARVGLLVAFVSTVVAAAVVVVIFACVRIH
jgi:hypothetical protein